MTEAPHAADQAGGEIVYSDDGLEDLAPVKPPARIQQDVVSVDITAEQAFQIFADRSGGTPLQRWNRLKSELDALQEELTANTYDEPATVSMEQIQSLQQQLEHTRLLHSNRQDQLTATIDAATSSTTTAAAVPASTRPALEERLQALEASVGSTDIVQRLIALEQRNLDDKQVDMLQRKAKTIRQDLEAAAKARNKLQANTSGVDQKKLTELYDAQQELQGFIPQLPALVQRLHALAAQHTEAATYGARLAATEAAATALQQQVGAAELAVAQLEQNLQENLRQMQANLKELE